MAVGTPRLIASRALSVNDKGETTGQRTYLVICTDKDADNPENALAVCPLPLTPYSSNSSGVVVVRSEAREHEVTAAGGTTYHVVVDYGTQNVDPKQSDPNPLNRSAIITLGFDAYEETRYLAPWLPTAIDASGANVALGPPSVPGHVVQRASFKWGKAICNSAGDPFDPSIVDTYYDPVVTIRKNMAALPWTTVKKYCNTVNTDAFTINYRGNQLSIDIGTAWMAQLTSTSEFENGVPYEAVTVVIKIREDGWRRNVLDQGFQQLNNSDLPPRPIRDVNGDPVRRPAFLDGNGNSLKPGNLPVFLRWYFKRSETFGILPFWNG